MNQIVATTETSAKWLTERGLQASSYNVRQWMKRGLIPARWWAKGYIMTEEDVLSFLSHVTGKEIKQR